MWYTTCGTYKTCAQRPLGCRVRLGRKIVFASTGLPLDLEGGDFRGLNGSVLGGPGMAAQLWRVGRRQGVQNPLAACQGETVPAADPHARVVRRSLGVLGLTRAVGNRGNVPLAVAPGGVVVPAVRTGRCRP